MLRPTGDPVLLAHPLLFHGIILHLDGELDRAQAVLEEALICARSTGDHWYEAYAEFNLGYVASLRGKYAEGYQ